MAAKTQERTWFTVLTEELQIDFGDHGIERGVVALTKRDDKRWKITVTYRVDNSGADAVGLEVWPMDGYDPDEGKGIGSVMLRELNIGEAIAAGRHALAIEARDFFGPLHDVKPRAREKSRKRRPLDEAFFLDLAYRAAALAGHKAAAEQLAADLGYSKAHIGRLLGQCEKEYGFLGKASAGRFERELTDKAKARKKEIDGNDL